MIKKSIVSILIILILINSIGCYSYNQINKEDTEKNKKYDKVKITILDNKVYYLRDVEIQGSVLKGFKRYKPSYGQMKVEEVVISIKEIKKIEVETFDTGSTTVVIVVSLLALGGIIWFIVEMKEAMEK